jgi:hypothetical protein
MGDQNLLSRAPPCFGRHFKLLVPAAFSVVSIHSSFKEGWRQAAGRKNECRMFITTWKHVVPTPLSEIRVGRRRRSEVGTCFLLPFSSMTSPCSFLLFSCLFTYPSFIGATSARVPIYTHTHYSFRYVTFIPPHKIRYQANLSLFIFSVTDATFKLPLIYSFLIVSILIIPHNIFLSTIGIF